jgi:glycosyltransferase involved in cell wall biosynthesis
LRILIDAHMAGERESGNERYIVNLVAALQGLVLPADFIIAASHPELFEGACQSRTGWRVVKVSASAWRRLGFELPYLVRHEQVDLLHVTYAAPLWPGCKVLTTIHDVSFRPHPEWFSLRDLLVLRFGVGLTLAAGGDVVTISEHSREEIRRYYGALRNSIHVAHLAGDSCFGLSPDELGKEVIVRLGIKLPYILAVGNLQPRKNLKRLIQATAQLKERGIDPFQLVIAGKAQWRESDVSAEIKRLGLERDVCFLGYVPDDVLTLLYSHASVFVYPSLYEGFGLPVLEAMACGAPVVTSDCTAIPEVSGAAALLVDPCDTGALSVAIEQVLMDPALQARMRADGFCQAARFSWLKTALDTWKVYQQIGEKT